MFKILKPEEYIYTNNIDASTDEDKPWLYGEYYMAITNEVDNVYYGYVIAYDTDIYDNSCLDDIVKLRDSIPNIISNCNAISWGIFNGYCYNSLSNGR